jgi:rod shape-determining protein MreD
MGDTRPKKLEEHIIHEFLLILGMVALALAQTTLMPAPFGFPPVLLLVVVVSRVLVGVESDAPEAGLMAAMRWAFYGGIALDVCTATPFGSHALALLLAAMLVAVLASRVRTGNAFFPLLGVLVGTLMYELCLAGMYHITGGSVSWQDYALAILLPSMLITLILTLPVFHLMRWYLKS